jgi:hypothetical protein
MSAEAIRDHTTIDRFHADVLCDVFGTYVSDRDAFLLFTLFHTNSVELTAPVLSDRPSVRHIATITQRHCGKALAALWRGRDDPRASYTHWYWRWNGEWGAYAHAEGLDENETARLHELTARLEQHQFISRFVREE